MKTIKALTGIFIFPVAVIMAIFFPLGITLVMIKGCYDSNLWPWQFLKLGQNKLDYMTQTPKSKDGET